MSRIAEIFLRVRDTLNDHGKKRWSDETLLRNLNEGLVDIATKTGLFKNSIAIPLYNGQEIYQLPPSVIQVKHCTYNWNPLPLKTSGWMAANRETDWRYTTTENDITLAVFDEVKRREIRVYPRPFGDYTFDYIPADSVYGVSVALDEYAFSSEYGVMSSIVDPDVNSESLDNIYGVLASMAVAKAFIVYYTERPPKITAIEQDLPLDECFDTALKFYVTGLALRNDLDTQNRSMANEEFVFYQRELDIIEDVSDTDSVGSQNFESHYNPMG